MCYLCSKQVGVSIYFQDQSDFPSIYNPVKEINPDLTGIQNTMDEGNMLRTEHRQNILNKLT